MEWERQKSNRKKKGEVGKIEKDDRERRGWEEGRRRGGGNGKKRRRLQINFFEFLIYAKFYIKCFICLISINLPSEPLSFVILHLHSKGKETESQRGEVTC